MQFQAFRYFIATAKAGSVRAASESLHVAGSAISRQIAMLEEEFGAPLFERHAGGMSLTDAGAILLREAHLLLRDLERMRSEVDNLQNLRRGHVKICSSEGAVSNLLFSTMAHFRDQYPGITIEIVVSGSRVALGALLEQNCDIAIVFDPEANADIEVVKSAPQPVCIVASSKDPRLRKKRITLPELEKLRPCLLDQSFSVRRLFDRVVMETGIHVTPALTINSIELAKRYAAMGLGLAIMPLYAVRHEIEEGSLKASRIDHPLFDHATVGLCRHRYRAPPVAARAFLAALSEQFDAFALS